ncbi:MAG TPA: 50S ribosomal protein L25 [Planctomycetota bacterium]|nr:50S ribosomal protein L25 [Planctomycetota bacterium]
METLTLEAKDRGTLGTANSRRLRRDGLIPAVLYGKKVANLNLAVDRDAFASVMRHHGRILDVKLPDGKVEKAILKEIQWDTFGEEVLHIDLGRVALDDKIHLKVGLRFSGDPKGVAAGGHLEVHMHEAMIECLAGAIPDVIKIDVAHLDLDQVMRVKDVPLPHGVKILEHAEAAVAGVKMAHLEELVPGAPAGAEAAGGAEPEVIAKGKKEEEGGEGAEGGAAPKAEKK